jgi:hypothetical protein
MNFKSLFLPKMEISGTYDRLQLKWPDRGHYVNTRMCFELKGRGDCDPKAFLSFAAAVRIPLILCAALEAIKRHNAQSFSSPCGTQNEFIKRHNAQLFSSPCASQNVFITE